MGRVEKSEHPMYRFVMRKLQGKPRHYFREWREYRRLTQKQIEERMEYEPGEPLISRVSIGRIERGEQAYTQPILEAFAHAVGATPTEVLEVNPLKEGEVVDLVRLLRNLDKSKLEQLTKIARALA
jgi:transcriptional regulator with XRE-family HTH domain